MNILVINHLTSHFQVFYQRFFHFCDLIFLIISFPIKLMICKVNELVVVYYIKDKMVHSFSKHFAMVFCIIVIQVLPQFHTFF